jgi:uncharacterized protein YjiS (DUF1127 family)
MTRPTQTIIPLRPTRPRMRVFEPLRWLCRAMARQRQRRALRELDDRMLRDIGLTRDQAQDEARKPFWKP